MAKSKKGKGKRVVVHLECTSCRKNNMPGVARYTTFKNRANTPKRLELRKYCKYEHKYTLFKEVK